MIYAYWTYKENAADMNIPIFSINSGIEGLKHLWEKGIEQGYSVY